MSSFPRTSIIATEPSARPQNEQRRVFPGTRVGESAMPRAHASTEGLQMNEPARPAWSFFTCEAVLPHPAHCAAPLVMASLISEAEDARPESVRRSFAPGHPLVLNLAQFAEPCERS